MIYVSVCAKQAMESNYGGKEYWDYLDNHALELNAFFLDRGDKESADFMLTRTLPEALMGNDGE